jgi:hypothetical protein
MCSNESGMESNRTFIQLYLRRAEERTIGLFKECGDCNAGWIVFARASPEEQFRLFQQLHACASRRLLIEGECTQASSFLSAPLGQAIRKICVPGVKIPQGLESDLCAFHNQFLAPLKIQVNRLRPSVIHGRGTTSTPIPEACSLV